MPTRVERLIRRATIGMGIVAVWGGGLLFLAEGGCQPRIEDRQFTCEPNDVDPCPPGWACLAWGADHYCFASSGTECDPNGRIDPGEQCDATAFLGDCADYGYRPGLLFCTTKCTAFCTECGNGRVEITPEGVGEECDCGTDPAHLSDGCVGVNGAPDGTCRADCLIVRCGNGVVDWQEECDDGNQESGDGCSPACTLERCGDGVVDYGVGEQCDDANVVSHDGCSSGCTLELWAWREWHPFPDTLRMGHAVAYDVARQRVVLFGGAADGEPSDQTWEYDGVRWIHRETPVSPPPLWGHSMAYDAARQRVLLHGGGSPAGANMRTWEYDGVTWREVVTDTSLPALTLHRMVYDTSRQRVILFGGMGLQGYSHQTWVYDGVDWRDLSPSVSPPARCAYGMVYDEARDRVVVFGGSNLAGYLNDTWELDGDNWVAAGGYPRPAGREATMTYDAVRERVVLFGGWTAAGAVGDTWEFDGFEWIARAHAMAPSPRGDHAMVFDGARERVVLVGGETVEQAGTQTWEQDANGWARRELELRPGGRAFDRMAYDPTRARMVLFGGRSVTPGTDRTWEFDGTQWVLAAPLHHPPPRSFHVLVFDGEQLLLYGGRYDDLGDNRPVMGDTWLYDGVDWEEVADAGAPSARVRVAAAYDVHREQVVLFGGVLDGGPVTDETWLWRSDTRSWNQDTSTASPPPRHDAKMAWHGALGGVVLFGGFNDAGGAMDDTHLYDGNGWREILSPISPPARAFHILVLDSQREVILLHGGNGALGQLSDVWELNGETWSEVNSGEGPVVRSYAMGAYDQARRSLVMFGGQIGEGEFTQETWLLELRSGHPDELCGNGIDDDRDGLVDCDDGDCWANLLCL